MAVPARGRPPGARGALVTRGEEAAGALRLLDAIAEPAVLAYTDGTIAHLNGAAMQFFDGEQLLRGVDIRVLMPFVVRDQDGEAAAVWQGRLPGPGGRIRDVDVTVARDAVAGEPCLDAYLIHDVSAYAELNRMREQLLYAAAHELGGAVGRLEIALGLLDDYASMPASEFDGLLHMAQGTTSRLRILLDDLLSAGSIQSGRFTVHPRPVPVAGLVEEAVAAGRSAIEAERQRIEIEAFPASLQVNADPVHAGRVLINLLSNAAKYGSPRGTICVRVAPDGNFVRFAVEDDGPGIPAEQQAGLFERFYRVRAAGDQPGIGLGLAIARGIVDAHGGTIGVTSGEGQGTSVWFTLPLAGAAV